jgi:hypothetical protein
MPAPRKFSLHRASISTGVMATTIIGASVSSGVVPTLPTALPAVMAPSPTSTLFHFHCREFPIGLRFPSASDGSVQVLVDIVRRGQPPLLSAWSFHCVR